MTALLFATANVVTSREFDGRRWCIEQTGLYTKDIIKFHERNEGCTIDCETRKSLLVSMHREHRNRCLDSDTRYCLLGKCITEDEEYEMSMAAMNQQLSNITLNIYEANVWQSDPPLAGESDVFIIVRAKERCEPFYQANEVVCHTVTKSNSNHAMWGDKGFECRMMPVSIDCGLLFEVMDSDDTVPDRLFNKTTTIARLLDHGRDKLAHDGRYHVTVGATRSQLITYR